MAGARKFAQWHGASAVAVEGALKQNMLQALILSEQAPRQTRSPMLIFPIRRQNFLAPGGGPERLSGSIIAVPRRTSCAGRAGEQNKYLGPVTAFAYQALKNS